MTIEISTLDGIRICTTDEYETRTAWARSGSLSGADLRGADLSGADLSGADLSGADLSGANLRGADLSGANLREANLSWADLSWANLREADLRGANLSWADLSEVNLSGADLSEADLSEANLRWANLSGAVGLLDSAAWLRANFETDAEGVIVYKRIGGTEYPTPASWLIEPGAYLTEVVNPSRTVECASGVNFGTRAWCAEHYIDAALWRCRIEWLDLAGVVVPYHTDGKARCARLRLLEIVE